LAEKPEQEQTAKCSRAAQQIYIRVLYGVRLVSRKKMRGAGDETSPPSKLHSEFLLNIALQ
jgi:hypothetical protein